MKHHLLFFLCLLGLLPACVDEIPLPAPGEAAPPLVIQGRVSKGEPSLIRVQLSLAASFAADDFPERISGAQVSAVDRDGRELLVPEVDKGLYERLVGADEPQSIEIGRAYQLQVRLPDGRIYHSDFESILPVPRPDSLSYTAITRAAINESGNIEEVPVLQVYLYSPLTLAGTAGKPALKWDFTGVWQLRETDTGSPAGARSCYVSQGINLDRVVVLDGREVDADYLDRRFLLEEPIDHRFAVGYYLTVIQQSLSPAAYTYWSQVAAVTERSGGLFEKPPASVPGNIRNIADPAEKVLGFFYAGAADTLRKRISLPSDLRPRPNCPANLSPSMGIGQVPEECLNCLLWPTSVLQRPPYWE